MSDRVGNLVSYVLLFLFSWYMIPDQDWISILIATAFFIGVSEVFATAMYFVYKAGVYFWDNTVNFRKNRNEEEVE